MPVYRVRYCEPDGPDMGEAVETTAPSAADAAAKVAGPNCRVISVKPVSSSYGDTPPSPATVRREFAATRPVTDARLDDFGAMIFWRVFWAIIASHLAMATAVGIIYAIATSGE